MTPSTSRHKVFVIGLVGGVASGKSQVARMFASQGAAVIDADALGHSVLQSPQVAAELGRAFGPDILDSNGSVDRERLGRLVFGSDAESNERLKQLEHIVHPLIRAQAVKLLQQYQLRGDPPAAIVIDAPLLLEANWAPLCDLILFVDSPTEIRRARALQRGWTAEHFAAREDAQQTLNDKRAAATHFVSGTLDESSLRQTIAGLLRQMRPADVSRGP